MGHVFADIDLSNPRRRDMQSIKVKALVDTGALMLCIPEHIALQLNLETESMREVSVADGRSRKVPYVGPVKVGFGDRFCYVGALVLGDEVLLGAVPVVHQQPAVRRPRGSTCRRRNRPAQRRRIEPASAPCTARPRFAGSRARIEPAHTARRPRPRTNPPAAHASPGRPPATGRPASTGIRRIPGRGRRLPRN